MTDKKRFYKNMAGIAIPITIQSLFQASLSLIDQIMIGHLGSDNIAGVGLGAKFASLFVVTVTAIVTVAGIMITQYRGSKNEKGVSDSFFINLYLALFATILFTLISTMIPNLVMNLYSNDNSTIEASVTYLRITAFGFLPMTATLMISALLRNVEYAKYPMYASVISVILNTFLNYVLILGKLGFPKLGLAGAALATTLARVVEFIFILIMFIIVKNKLKLKLHIRFYYKKDFITKVCKILLPILVCEFLWSLGENVYAIIYGHIGTEACAAMTLTYPIQSLMIGVFTGVASASAILIGKRLGENNNKFAYEESILFIKLTLAVSIIMGVLIAILGKYYVLLFNVSDSVRKMTENIFYAYALVFSAKVMNMVLGGGILRSGGKTKNIMFLNIFGTWCIGVPLGIITSYVFNLPIYYVYFFLSIEEFVRLLLGVILFRSKKWIHNVTESEILAA